MAAMMVAKQNLMSLNGFEGDQNEIYSRTLILLIIIS